MGYDYIIVGQGLAGTVLAETFISHGKKVLVVECEGNDSSSAVAAGIYNPITGKRMVKTWMADEIFPFLEKFYLSIGEKLSAELLFKMPIYKPFSTIQEQNFWISQTGFSDHADILKAEPNPQYPQVVEDHAGGFFTKLSGFVDVAKLILLFRDYLKKNQSYVNDHVSKEDLEINDQGVRWKGKTARKIIFCEGHRSANNWLFHWLPFVLAKGELLTVNIDGFPCDVIINKDLFILPIGKKQYKVGATYKWDFQDNKITEEARTEIAGKLSKITKAKYTIEHQEAGIRPTVKDRRPLIGIHPEYKTVGIFNGLGTKGVSLAPYFAEQFYHFLESGKKLNPESDIERFRLQYAL